MIISFLHSTNKTLNLSKQLEPLELLTKPKKLENPNSTELENPSEEFSEALAPFLKFFKFDGSESDSDDGANDESESDAGILHQNLTSASSALQRLLRKLGAGLDDLLPSSTASGSSSHQSGRLKKILTGLRAEGEEGRQVEALTQLCEMLSIGMEESLGSFFVDSFVPVLVGLLNHESNADIILLATRALTHLYDVLPSSCAVVIHYGTVPCFCARLLTNEYMDLVEQVLDHASVCLMSIAEAFASSPEKLDELCNHGLVAQAARLISISNSGGQASLTPSTYTVCIFQSPDIGLIHLLSTCASGSLLGAKTLLLLGISGIVKDILSGFDLVANISVSPALTRSPE
ncbi:uncharacterized protein A4U43_C07F15450 [Asparagus officinalis]|uniref:HECT-type E3 ubiquitin transferase n=1 Tax=Asparagus officinalis TaxID=4686 RepID=A0A5P1EE54_ASPOF|nr:uncharacterized protein A4U43_C07F15450 [Asparagus officinalis]